MFAKASVKPKLLEFNLPHLPAEVFADELFENGKLLADETIKQIKHSLEDQPDGYYTFEDIAASSCYVTKLHQHYYVSAYPLGQGTFGKVQAKQDLDSGKFYAAKYLSFDASLNLTQHQYKKLVDAEIKHLREMRQLVDILILPDENQYELFMELAPGKSLKRLSDLSKADKQKISSQQWLKMTINTLKAIHDLHVHGILHRDLKPNNIIIDTRTADVHIVDLGVAIDMDKDEKSELHIHLEKTQLVHLGKTLQTLLQEAIGDKDIAATVQSILINMQQSDETARHTLASDIAQLEEMTDHSETTTIALLDANEYLSADIKQRCAFHESLRQHSEVWLIDTHQRPLAFYNKMRAELAEHDIYVGQRIFFGESLQKIVAHIPSHIAEHKLPNLFRYTFVTKPVEPSDDEAFSLGSLAASFLRKLFATGEDIENQGENHIPAPSATSGKSDLNL